MSGFNSNYFNRHLINDMRNALNSVFIGEGETSARNLEQFRERLASDKAARIARGKANNAAKAERGNAGAAAPAPAAGTPAAGAAGAASTPPAPPAPAATTPAAPVPHGAARRNPAAINKTSHLPRSGQINTNPSEWEQLGGRPLSINNADGSFNISAEAQAQAKANRNPETPESPPRKRYVNPNSPEGRVEASIAAENEPDMQRDRPRDQGGRIVTNDRGVQNPDAVGYAAGQRASDASLAADARAAKAGKADDNEELEDSIPNNGGLLTQLRGAISDQRGTDPRAANTKATNALKDLTNINTREASARVASSFRGEDQKNQAQMDLRAKEAKEATANTNRDFVAAAEYDALRPSVTANDDTTLPARAAQGETDRTEGDRVAALTAIRTKAEAAKQYVLDRRLQDERNAEDERAARAARFGATPRAPSNIVDPSADRNLMWNGTIGPNGGQRAKPAGSPKPTLKVENTVKPKTPPQTFFPMR